MKRHPSPSRVWTILLGLTLIAVAGFPDDNYEANNTLATAYDLSANENVWLSGIAGFGILSDEDWYAISVASASRRIVIECIFLQQFGNIDINLVKADGSPLIGTRGATSNEHIDYTVPSAGTYYIRVHGDQNGNYYNLRWDRMDPSVADPYEPNDTRTSGYLLNRYLLLDPLQREWLSNVRGKAVAGDNDWYRIVVPAEIPARRYVRVVCEFKVREGDIDLALYPLLGGPLVTRSTQTDNEGLWFEVPADGTFYLLVSGGSPGQPYDLWWDIMRPPGGDDEYEAISDLLQNDSQGGAWYFGRPYTYHDWGGNPLHTLLGIGRQNDADWFAIDVREPRLLVASVFNHNHGDLNLSIYDPVGSPLGTVDSSSDNEYVDLELSTTGRHYIVVDGPDNDTDYLLCWQDVTTDGDDAMEENDTQATAHEPAFNWEGLWLSQTSGIGIQRDSDFYRIPFAADDRRIVAKLRAAEPNHGVQLAIHYPLPFAAGTTAKSVYGYTEQYVLDYTIWTTGTHYLEVFGTDAGNLYDLQWTLGPGDSYEPNNSMAEATTMTFPRLSDRHGYGIHDDDDWYAVFVPGDRLRIAVDCEFDAVRANLDMELLDSSAQIIASSSSPNSTESLSAALTEAGTYYIRVFSGAPTEAWYDLSWRTYKTQVHHDFFVSEEGWTWFDNAPAMVVPGHGHDPKQSFLAMSETATDQIVFGSWESPKDPLDAVLPLPGRFYRARFQLESTVTGASCPGFRLRGITTRVTEPSPSQWEPDFAHPDFNASHEVYFSTVDLFHVPGREPGSGKEYTLLMVPEQSPTLDSLDTVNYFACDLLDLDTFDSDDGTIRIKDVWIDGFDLPPPGIGLRVHELSFNDQSVSLGFQGWMGNLKTLDPVQGNVAGIGMSATPDSVSISVTPTNEWFVATQTSAATPLTPGRYYRAIFSISSTETGAPNTAGPTVRAGFFSSRLVFSADKQLTGGSAFARFGPTPRPFEVWMQAPSEFQNGVTEPIGLRFMSWLGDNPTGWPFFNTVSGQVTLHEVRTEWFSPYP